MSGSRHAANFSPFYVVPNWRLTRTLVAAASVLSLVAGFLIAPAIGVSPATMANAVVAANFAEPLVEFKESYQDLTGIHVYVAEPTLLFESYDEEEAPGGYPSYSIDIEIAEAEGAPLIIQDSVETSRDFGSSHAEWKAPFGVLEFEHSYALRYRLSADGVHGAWVGWFGFNVTPPSPAPILVSPSDGALSAKPAELVAQIPNYVSTSGAFDSVVFTVEEGWQNGAPTTVAQLSGAISVDGIARVYFSPYTNAGSYRWTAQWIGAGYSEPSEHRELLVSEKAPAAQYLQAFPGPLSATLQWQSQSPVFAPVQYADITIMPGNISRRIDAPGRSSEFSELPIGDYVASITLTNELGTSGPVTTAFSVVPTYPPAPLALTSLANASGVHLTWNAPANDGGSPIDNYRVQIRSYDGGTNTTVNTTELFADIALETGFTYQAWVYAVNAKGQGNGEVTTFETVGVPGTPQNLEIRQGDGFVNVYWDAPLEDGGRSVTKYRVKIGGLEAHTITATYGRMGAQFDGLENGKIYTVTIRAINEVGAGEKATLRQILSISSDIDSDADGLPDVAEARFGTSSALADTDGDGISDVDETLMLSAFLSPTLADTDGNGTIDADEDSDGDGISNAIELANGTNPGSPDSDHDSLSDSEEIASGTNPLSADTDGDGVSDDLEIAIGLDPNIAISGSGGVPDSEQVSNLTVRDVRQLTPQLNEYGDDRVDVAAQRGDVSAEVSAPAGRLGDIVVTSSPAENLVGSLTVVAEIVDRGPESDEGETVGPVFARVDEGTEPVSIAPLASRLTLGYAEGVATARLQELAPVRWNAALATWEFADNDVSVSTAERTISILSPDLGVRYAVVDLRTWRAHVSECDSGYTGRPQLDVEFVIDGMPSVLANDSTNERFVAARSIVDSLEPGDHASVREFGLLGIVFSGPGSAPGAWSFETDVKAPLNEEELFGLDTLEVTRATLDALEVREPRNGGYSPEGNIGWDPERVLAPSVPNSSQNINPYVKSATPLECRKKVVVLITDGEKDGTIISAGDGPAPDRPFVDAGIPVHVLDLGIGSPGSAGWLEELATQTGGSYSYVPTQSDLTGWIEDVTPVDWPTIDPTKDTDHDGIPDVVEIYGVSATLTVRGPYAAIRFYSNPKRADSDNDGIPDNVEIGQRLEAETQGAEWTVANINRNFWVVSDPSRKDSDFDGLDDRSEYDLELYPLSGDSDGDLLLDSQEEMNGTFSQMYDTDSDGFSDAYEIWHSGEGFDPLVYNEKVSEHEWLSEAAVGFFCGEVDICARFTIPWLVGNIASGVLVFGDLRDGIALIAKGDFLAASLCAVGLIPGIGDALGASAKVLKFINKLTAPFGFRAASTSGAGAVDDAIELGSHQAMQLLRRYEGNSKKFVAALAEIQPSIVASLRVTYKLSDGAIEKLVLKNGVFRLKLYAALRRVPGAEGEKIQVKFYAYTAETLPRYLPSGKAGETAMAKIINLPSDFKQTIERIKINGEWRGRFWDGKYVENGVTHLFEAKVGYVSSAFARFQVAKDAKYMKDNPGVVMEWHFYASESTGAIGPSKDLLDELTAAGIVMVFHMPGGAL